MSMLTLIHNVAALVTPRWAGPATGAPTQTAGATAAVTGITIDRNAFNAGSLPKSAVFTANFYTSLSAGKTLSFAFEVDSSPDGSTWTSYATQAATVYASATGAQTGQADFAVDLGNAQRYLRLIVTPTLSNTGTDTVQVIPTAVFAGFDRLPAGA
jgi:hypothetical protein